MAFLDSLKAWAKRLRRDGVTVWFACRHPATPWFAKAIGVVIVAYALSPIDLIPDAIPVLGYLDEVVLLPCLIWLAIRMLPAEVLAECREQADAWLAMGREKPRSLLGACIVVTLWIVAAWFVWKLVFSG